jgi:hypothetical protein
MMHISPSLRRSRSWSVAAVAAVTVLAVVGFVSAGSAAPSRHHHHPVRTHGVAPPPAAPTNANQIQNLDQVETAIKAYYGDTPTETPDPVNGTTMLHVASPTSAYAKQMHRIEARAEAFLARRSTAAGKRQKAIVFDVDDTTLNTYNYEIYSNFVYDPTTNADFVNAAAFPAVFGMPRLAHDAKADGYTIFFITGRPTTQESGTVTNLDKVGYPTVQASRLFLKDQSDPWLSSCTPNCTTTQYKSLTRQHIQSLGYRIIANFGDQFSDLRGGFSVRRFKIPNPMYFIP